MSECVATGISGVDTILGGQGWKLLIQHYSFLGISTDFRTGFSRHNRTHVL